MLPGWSGPAGWADGKPLEVIQGVPEYAAEGPVIGEWRTPLLNSSASRCAEPITLHQTI
jgi:hypothetical protein